jgi:hypothetical protein
VPQNFLIARNFKCSTSIIERCQRRCLLLLVFVRHPQRGRIEEARPAAPALLFLAGASSVEATAREPPIISLTDTPYASPQTSGRSRTLPLRVSRYIRASIEVFRTDMRPSRRDSQRTSNLRPSQLLSDSTASLATTTEVKHGEPGTHWHSSPEWHGFKMLNCEKATIAVAAIVDFFYVTVLLFASVFQISDCHFAGTLICMRVTPLLLLSGELLPAEQNALVFGVCKCRRYSNAARVKTTGRAGCGCGRETCGCGPNGVFCFCLPHRGLPWKASFCARDPVSRRRARLLRKRRETRLVCLTLARHQRVTC